MRKIEKLNKEKKKIEHIHNDPRIDCPACVEWIKAPMLKFRTMPGPRSPLDKEKEKLMQKVIDYEYAQIKKSKVFKLPFGTLIWTPKK